MPKKRCPICSKEFVYQSIQSHRTFPFCSEMCAAKDLGVWMTDGYAIECEPTAADLDELEQVVEEGESDEPPDPASGESAGEAEGGGDGWSVKRPWRSDERN